MPPPLAQDVGSPYSEPPPQDVGSPYSEPLLRMLGAPTLNPLLTVNYSPGKGRYLTTTTDIAPGTLIFSEPHYAAVSNYRYILRKIACEFKTLF